MKRWIAQILMGWEAKANHQKYLPKLKAILLRWIAP